MSEAPKIYGQLLRAQQAFGRAIKDANNPHFKSSYADLGSVWDACAAHLHNQGLFVSHQVRHVDSGRYECVTKVYNEAGEFLESAFPLAAQQPGPQPMGSALTYARRYGLSALLGIIADDDDDGNAAQQPATRVNRAAPTATDPVATFQAELCKTKTRADVEAVYRKHRQTMEGLGYGDFIAAECKARTESIAGK